MPETATHNKVCIVIGASHAGVNFALSLRKEGWEGEIILYDADSTLPYHRPPLSKAYLTEDAEIEKYALRPAAIYEKENITLRLGKWVRTIDRADKEIVLEDGSRQSYDKLVLATGARPFIPPIPGLDAASNLFPIRTAEDVRNIRKAVEAGKDMRVVIIGGGYIGLETAASMTKLGATVTVLEREERILSRVTCPKISQFFEDLHTRNEVDICTQKHVVSIESSQGLNTVVCSDDTRFEADVIILGVGIRVNLALAQEAGLEIENGIRVDATARTSDEDIYAIGDCTYHHNPHYDRFVRLESVQNAADQAKVAATAICGKDVVYDKIPWFWSDQYDVKLQMVGLSDGYTEAVVRKEDDEGIKLSVWYMKEDELLAVAAVNNTRAYVLGTKCIKDRKKIDTEKLVDPAIVLKPANMLMQ